MYEQHWTASLTPLMAVGVALLSGPASSGPVVPVCWRPTACVGRGRP